MTTEIKGYLMSLVASGLLMSIVMAVQRKGTIRNITGILGGLLMIVVTVSPLVRIDADAVAESIWRMDVDAVEFRKGVEIGSRELLAQVITERCCSYILDKARSVGMEAEVELFLDEEGEVPYPVGVRIRGQCTAQAKNELQRFISEEMGIPVERQEWIIM